MSRLAGIGFGRLAAIAAFALATLGTASVAAAVTYNVSTGPQFFAAVGSANASPGADTINLAPGVYVTGGMEVTEDLTINGGGRPGTVIDGSSLPGTPSASVFSVVCDTNGRVTLTLNDLTIQNGREAVYGGCGGSSLLRVNRSTIKNHESGLSVVYGAAEITNSTISGNRSYGIFFESNGSLMLVNDTIVFNEMGCGGCGSAIARNTIIASNLRDCGGLSAASERVLDTDGSCGASPLTVADPLIGPLADNGGPTPTHALLDGSPAIDYGTNASCPAADARGVARPQGLFCDVGAFEKTPSAFESAASVVSAGGQVTTDTELDGATAADPVETTITHPGGGSIAIAEGPVAEFGFLGQRVSINVSPPASAAAPLVIVFQLDASIIPAGQDETTIVVVKDGVGVPACAGPAGTASPDPCVSLRERLGDLDVRLTVLSSTASDWDLGPGSAPPPPVVPEISVGDASVVEGDAGTATAEFVVTLSQPTTETVTVSFETQDGTAATPGDYAAALDSVTFLPGETSHTIGVLVLGDTDPEPDETFLVVLFLPANATIADGQAQGTILNDDTAPPPPPTENARVQAEGSIGSPRADFEVEAFARGGLFEGEVNYYDRSNRLHLRSTSITGVTCEDGRASIEGAGRVGRDTVAFRVEVEDLGRRGRNDTFSIAWLGYSAAGRLQRGNVRVSCGPECGP